MDAHSLGGKGWIVKAPYVQNQRGFLLIYISSDISSEELKKLFQTIIQNPNRQFNKNGVMNADVFPYLIIQPRLDPAESKVVLLNGSPKFICSIQGKRGWFLSSCLMYASILVVSNYVESINQMFCFRYFREKNPGTNIHFCSKSLE